MRKISIVVIISLVLASVVYAASPTLFREVAVSVGLKVGASGSADSKSIVDLTSTTKGLLIPRMTTAQKTAIASPTNGLLVYDTDLNQLFKSISGTWVQIGRNMGTTTSPDASAVLDLGSTTQGLLLPRMTTGERDAVASPANGLLIYNTTTNGLNMRSGGVWVNFVGTGDFLRDGSLAMTGQFLSVSSYSVSAPEISKSGDANTGIGFPTADTIGLITAGTERLRISSTGERSSVITGGSTLYPSYPVRAWARWSGSTENNLSGTYSRTGTTVTVTATAHGHIVGHRVFLDFTSGTATDGSFEVVTVADANTLTITHGTSGSTSGNVTLKRALITSSENVNSITHDKTGAWTVNFTSGMPDNLYAASGAAVVADAASGVVVAGDSRGMVSAYAFQPKYFSTACTLASTTSIAMSDCEIMNIAVYR